MASEHETEADYWRTLYERASRVVEAAKVWANFQDPDSLLDQKTDTRVRVQAETARQMLLVAIDNLMEGRPESQTD